PALVVFHDAGVISALTISLRASVANWRPTGIFGLAVLFYGGVLPALAGTLARALGATGGTIVALGLLLPYMLVFLATFHIAAYVAYPGAFSPQHPAPRE